MSIRKRKDHQGVKQGYHPRHRKPYIDYDYIDKLSQEELEFLGRFTFEYYGGDFIINDTYIKNEDGSYENITHRDLRKERQTEKFYKTKNGRFSNKIKHKYSDKNIHPEKFWDDIRYSNVIIQRDMMSMGYDYTNSKNVEDFLWEQEGIENADPAILHELLYDWSVEQGEDFIHRY